MKSEYKKKHDSWKWWYRVVTEKWEGKYMGRLRGSKNGKMHRETCPALQFGQRQPGDVTVG